MLLSSQQNSNTVCNNEQKSNSKRVSTSFKKLFEQIQYDLSQIPSIK